VRLTVRLFASLRERAGRSELELAGLPAGLDVAGLKRELERLHPELGDLAAVRGVLGTRYVGEDARLEDGAEVALLPPVSGGSGGDDDLERGAFELSPEPLDPALCRRRVAHPSCGAIVVFIGTTRDTNRERQVARLEYEAFEEMAGPEMARIFARCRADFAGEGDDRRLRMLCRHRTGTVEVGEPSVVIAVASPHRALAFRAAQFLIDELKASLPVWKKEVYAEGEHWIGDRS